MGRLGQGGALLLKDTIFFYLSNKGQGANFNLIALLADIAQTRNAVKGDNYLWKEQPVLHFYQKIRAPCEKHSPTSIIMISSDCIRKGRRFKEFEIFQWFTSRL